MSKAIQTRGSTGHVGGELSPERPYACCARNLKLNPFYDRLGMISNTFGVFWKSEKPAENIGRAIITSLGQAAAITHWLAASMDKTVRLHLQAPPDFWLQFS